MRTLTVGHRYELENFERKDQPGQVIQFIEKEPKAGGAPGELVTVNDGTTNEEVMRMLIDRMEVLMAKFWSMETLASIEHMKAALRWQELRTENRKKRGVEGKALS